MRLQTSVLLSLIVTTLIWRRLDFESATFAGLPAYLIGTLQSVLKVAARLVFSLRKYDHITQLLQELHWLKMEQRIEYKPAQLDHRCLHDLAPSYLTNDIQGVSDLNAQR